LHTASADGRRLPTKVGGLRAIAVARRGPRTAIYLRMPNSTSPSASGVPLATTVA